MGEDVSKFGFLGSGKLIIDVLNKKCSYNDNPVDGLFIVGELNAWFLDQLKRHKMSSNDIEEALIIADHCCPVNYSTISMGYISTTHSTCNYSKYYSLLKH